MRPHRTSHHVLIVAAAVVTVLALSQAADAQSKGKAKKTPDAGITAQCNRLAQQRFPNSEDDMMRSQLVKACRANGGRI